MSPDDFIVFEFVGILLGSLLGIVLSMIKEWMFS